MVYENKCLACGSRNIKIQSEHYNGLVDSRVIVRCDDCCTNICTYGKTVQEAVDRYNSIANKEAVERR